MDKKVEKKINIKILNKEKHICRMELVPSFLYYMKGTKNEKRIEEK